MAWDPSKHARAPSGAAGGGRFITGQSSPQQDQAAKGAQKKLGGKLDTAAIRRFQRQHGLQVDGVIGRQTGKALLGDFAGAKNSKVGSLTHEQTRRLGVLGGGKSQPVRGTGGQVRVHRVTASTAPVAPHSSQPSQPRQPKQRQVTVGGVHAGFVSLHPHTGPHGAEMNFLAHDHTGEVMSTQPTMHAAARAVASNHRAMGSPGAIGLSQLAPTVAAGIRTGPKKGRPPGSGPTKGLTSSSLRHSSVGHSQP